MGAEKESEETPVLTEGETSVNGNESETTEDKPKADANHPDVKGLKSALTKTRNELDTLKQQLKAKERESLPELDKLKAELDELKNKHSTTTLENRRLKIGVGELKLPLAVAMRLNGDTDEAMRQDAEELIEYYREKEDANSSKKNTSPNDSSKVKTPPAKADMDTLLRAVVKGY